MPVDKSESIQGLGAAMPAEGESSRKSCGSGLFKSELALLEWFEPVGNFSPGAGLEKSVD